MKSSPRANEEFRLRLRESLRRAGILSQREFVDLVGMGVSTIKNMKSGASCSSDTQALVVAAINARLKAALQPEITRGWLFDVWKRTPKHSAKPLPKPVGRRQVGGRQLELDAIPDLLTPGTPAERMKDYYVKHFGGELGGILAARSKDIIVAVERGDFAQQESLGYEIARAAAEFPQLQAVGFYFAGEGIRLQGDLARPGIEREILYGRALQEYTKATVLNESDPRPLRGTGRILERREKLDDAEKYFLKANALAETRRANLPKDAPAALYLHHEYLRIIRHKIHCFLEQAQKSPTSKWNKEAGRTELRGWVQVCAGAHADHMQLFTHQTAWWRIEWFMGMVFLAKAWGFLGATDEMTGALVHSLSARREMIRKSSLQDVERDNLKWWCSVALAGKDVVSSQMMQKAEALSAALDRKADVVALNKVDEILRPFRLSGNNPLYQTQ